MYVCMYVRMYRFTMLWSVRYRVLPKIPRDSQRKIRANELNLGYALPTPRLGAESAEIPLPPWQPFSICTGECKTDPKVCVCTCTYVRMHLSAYICTYMCCVYVHTYVCMYVCLRTVCMYLCWRIVLCRWMLCRMTWLSVYVRMYADKWLSV